MEIIRPERVKARIENGIMETINEKTIPPEFVLEFRIMPETIQFNMISDSELDIIVETVKTTLDNIAELAQRTGKTTYKDTMFFPFEKHIDRSRALLEIGIHYRADSEFTGKRVNVILS